MKIKFLKDNKPRPPKNKTLTNSLCKVSSTFANILPPHQVLQNKMCGMIQIKMWSEDGVNIADTNA